MKGIRQASLLNQIPPDDLRIGAGPVLLDQALVLLDDRNAHAADMTAQETLPDDAHHHRMVEIKSAEDSELGP